MTNVTKFPHSPRPIGSPPVAVEAGASSSREPGAPAPSINGLIGEIYARAEQRLEQAQAQVDAAIADLDRANKHIEDEIRHIRRIAGEIE